MECPICYTNEATYVINCGSTVEHVVCDTCEVTMRMKEPATTKGRILKCPMCRVPEKETGKRSAFSYEHELSKLYAPRPAPRPDAHLTQERLIQMFPSLAPYFFERASPHRLAREAAIAQAEAARRQAERQPFAAQVAPATRAMRPPTIHNSFCQSGRRETGVCQTISKTKRKCTYSGCDKFVCRSCRQCLTH